MAGKRKLEDFSIIHLIPRLNIVNLLASQNGLTLTELMKLTNLTSGNLYSHCKVLVDAGIIEKTQIVHNGLKPVYKITPKGVLEYRKYSETLISFLQENLVKLETTDPNFRYALPASVFIESEDPEGNVFRLAKF